MTAVQEQAVPTAVPHVGQWRLQRIEVVNWGTFGGHHVIDVARQGFLLTGHSGSGKSSLVDAVAAVMTPPAKTRFNAAAADGGGRSDRSVAAYVRGAWRRQTDGATGEIVSDYLRTGATWSGVALRFETASEDDPDAVITLVRLFHMRAGENTAVSDLHVLHPGELDLLDLQPHARDGLRARVIKAAWPGATVTGTHSAFASRFCQVLGIDGDNALALLHKTQSARNLSSLDDLFRGFMLDLPETFALSDAAVDQFTELETAHRSVVTARRQVEMLVPLRRLVAEHAAHLDAAERAAQLADATGPFADAWELELARLERDRAAHEAAVRADEAAEAESGLTLARAQHQDAELAVRQHGGSAVAAQQERLEGARARSADVGRARRSVQARLAEVEIAMPGTRSEWEELRTSADRERERLDRDKAEGRDEYVERLQALGRARERARDLDGELAALRRVRSNLDGALLRARDAITRITGLAPAQLPFVGELLRVRDEHTDWAGPIERVLRPLATTLLVPAVHRELVLAAVDREHLRTRLTLEVVPREIDRPRPVGNPASLVHRVEGKEGPFRSWVQHTVSSQYDVACVPDATALAGVDRGVTRAGLVKSRGTRHVKDDRYPVDDRTRWVLGFDNADKVELLLERRRAAEADVVVAERAVRETEDATDAARARVNALRMVGEREWRDVDVEAVTTEVHAAEKALAELLAASSDLRAARAAADRLRDIVGERERAAAASREVHSAAQAQLAQVERAIEAREAQPAEPVAPAVHAELERRFHAQQRTIRFDGVQGVALKVQRLLETERHEADRSAAVLAQGVVRVLTEFAHTWPSMAGDLTQELEDRQGYLDLLARLENDRLPEFEERFFDLLRTQSQRNIGQLAALVRRAPGEIRDKVRPINASLRRSPFDRGRFLQITVAENRAPAVQDFLTDLRLVSSGSWDDGDREATEQRFAVLARLMARLGSAESADRSWRALCLDTRRHVRFTGREEDEDGVVVNVHDSSAGLSGGQRQKLVVFCLAAALRYQLTPEGSELPSFGTVILDEAFDKADAEFTRMAMDVFVAFGFHMVLATPLKLLQTLEAYVGGVGLARCRDFRHSTIGLVTLEEARGPAAGPGADHEGEPADGEGSRQDA